MNKRISKKLRKRYGHHNYHNYRKFLVRQYDGFVKWRDYGAPIGVIEGITIQRGAEGEPYVLNEQGRIKHEN